MKKIALLPTAVAAAALLTAGAIAQTPPKSAPTQPNQTQTTPQTTPAMPSSVQAATMQKPDQWRGSQLIGLDVYNANNENIGDINDVILGKDGKIEVVVIGVGGFLGMGEHSVGLPWDQVKFSDQPVKGNQGSPVSAEAGEKPDHAMVSLTKEQLKAMPAFKYVGQEEKKR